MVRCAEEGKTAFIDQRAVAAGKKRSDFYLNVPMSAWAARPHQSKPNIVLEKTEKTVSCVCTRNKLLRCVTVDDRDRHRPISLHTCNAEEVDPWFRRCLDKRRKEGREKRAGL